MIQNLADLPEKNLAVFLNVADLPETLLAVVLGTEKCLVALVGTFSAACFPIFRSMI